GDGLGQPELLRRLGGQVRLAAGQLGERRLEPRHLAARLRHLRAHVGQMLARGAGVEPPEDRHDRQRQDGPEQDHVPLLEPHRSAPGFVVDEWPPARRAWPCARESIGTSMEKLTSERVPTVCAALEVSTGSPSPGTAARRAIVRATWVWLKAMPSRCIPSDAAPGVAAGAGVVDVGVVDVGVWALSPVSHTCGGSTVAT